MVTGELQAELLPGLAVQLLEEGQDSQSVRFLAGLVHPTYWDAIDAFERLMEETNRTKLDTDKALRLLCYDEIVRFENGDGALYPTLHHLVTHYTTHLDSYSLDEFGWLVGLLDEWEGGFLGRPRNDIEADIRKELSRVRRAWEADRTLRTRLDAGS